ncbi:hypothetical protein OH76DRAFT_613263 [Lentinus brumalis]|uniref:Uncharacterized protein n=1 Tax=Lentinus brumalis TaxID=2498619 RepID=A0A371D8Q3_9APHY|nr:hypothetical protein OH76DRAFT_613263 [Polyporus brumalis]
MQSEGGAEGLAGLVLLRDVGALPVHDDDREGPRKVQHARTNESVISYCHLPFDEERWHPWLLTQQEYLLYHEGDAVTVRYTTHSTLRTLQVSYRPVVLCLSPPSLCLNRL